MEPRSTIIVIICTVCSSLLFICCYFIYQRCKRFTAHRDINFDHLRRGEMEMRDINRVTQLKTESFKTKILPLTPDEEDKYYATTNDVIYDETRVFTEDCVCLITVIKMGKIYNRWMGSITLPNDIGRCAVLTDITETVKRQNIFHWDAFIRKCLSLPKSQNIVRIVGISLQSINQYLISEHLDSETLSSIIKCDKTNQLISIPNLIKYISGILEGMETLTSYGFLHPGLSSNKILVTHEGDCKLYEFCLADDASKVAELKKSKIAFPSLNQFAPETLFTNEYTGYSDVWSTAVVVWELIAAGNLPFSVNNLVNHEMDVKIPSLSWPERCLQIKNKVLFDCWNHNCSLRPTIYHLRGSFLEVFDKLIGDSDYEIPIQTAYTVMRNTNRK